MKEKEKEKEKEWKGWFGCCGTLFMSNSPHPIPSQMSARPSSFGHTPLPAWLPTFLTHSHTHFVLFLFVSIRFGPFCCLRFSRSCVLPRRLGCKDLVRFSRPFGRSFCMIYSLCIIESFDLLATLLVHLRVFLLRCTNRHCLLYSSRADFSAPLFVMTSWMESFPCFLVFFIFWYI